MKKVVSYVAFDGTSFATPEECIEFEANHPFINESDIIFYSDNGKKIRDVCDNALLDCNKFIANSEAGLVTYQLYRERMQLKVPPTPLSWAFPLHYVLENGQWNCLEDVLTRVSNHIAYGYSDEYEDGPTHALPFSSEIIAEVLSDE